MERRSVERETSVVRDDHLDKLARSFGGFEVLWEVIIKQSLGPTSPELAAAI